MEIYRTLALLLHLPHVRERRQTYSGDSAYCASQVTGSSCSPNATPADECDDRVADRLRSGLTRSYRVDTYIVSDDARPEDAR